MSAHAAGEELWPSLVLPFLPAAAQSSAAHLDPLPRPLPTQSYPHPCPLSWEERLEGGQELETLSGLPMTSSLVAASKIPRRTRERKREKRVSTDNYHTQERMAPHVPRSWPSKQTDPRARGGRPGPGH